jgi:hypothetical protein
MLENSELIVLATVKEFFRKHTAKTITDFSHNEKCYQETKSGQIMPYTCAKDLRI